MLSIIQDREQKLDLCAVLQALRDTAKPNLDNADSIAVTTGLAIITKFIHSEHDTYWADLVHSARGIARDAHLGQEVISRRI